MIDERTRMSKHTQNFYLQLIWRSKVLEPSGSSLQRDMSIATTSHYDNLSYAIPSFDPLYLAFSVLASSGLISRFVELVRLTPFHPGVLRLSLNLGKMNPLLIRGGLITTT